ncbi:MAG: ATP synthase F1 subunit delta, partial [Clostridia bacterium]|nr:ATP synthase F1 subunit delta [Clostridia bacterium]
MNSISREYSMALFSLAAETHEEAAWGEALRTAAEVFEDEPAFVSLLSAPDIPRREREGIVEKAFSGLPAPVVSFLKLLSVSGHIRLFPECLEEYTELLSNLERVTSARVRSAVPLKEDEKTRLREKLEKISGRKVTLILETDP